MDENELKTNGIPAEEPAETAESLEELPEKYDSDAEETTDDYEEAEAEPEAEEPAADDKPVKSSDGKKTEEELEAENEARCDEALLTEKFCLT